MVAIMVIYRSFRLGTTVPRLFALLLFSWLSTLSIAASVTTSLDKETVTENELVQLTIRTDFPQTGSGPDLSVLKRDFEIISQNQNSQFRFNLGTSQSLNFWVVSLMPKSVGTLQIPPIKVGDYTSAPLTLVVKNAPQMLDANGNPPVYITFTASEMQPYLQQQVIFTLTLYTSVALQNANVSTPQHPDLLIERLLDDQASIENIRGTTYQVVRREFLAFPQKSGLLDIDPQTVSAMINTTTGRRLVKVQSQPLSLQVLPIPVSYTNTHWLPSRSVSVQSQLHDNANVRVGDTLIWQLDISAQGALPEQIMPLDFPSTRDYKLYPQPVEFEALKRADGVTGTQKITLEVVPTSAGTLTLPAVEIPYWDTEARRMAIASAQPIRLTIAPLPTSTAAAPDTPLLPAQSKAVAPISLNKPDRSPIASTQPEPMSLQIQTVPTSTFSPFKIIALSLTTLVIAFALLLLWRNHKQHLSSFDDVPTLNEFAPLSTQNEKTALTHLLQCCYDNDLQHLRGHLIEWARHRWGEDQIQSLDDIKRLSQSDELAQLIMESELMLYSNQTNSVWDGHHLAETLERFSSGQPKPSQASQLKTLYPNF